MAIIRWMTGRMEPPIGCLGAMRLFRLGMGGFSGVSILVTHPRTGDAVVGLTFDVLPPVIGNSQR